MRRYLFFLALTVYVSRQHLARRPRSKLVLLPPTLPLRLHSVATNRSIFASNSAPMNPSIFGHGPTSRERQSSERSSMRQASIRAQAKRWAGFRSTDLPKLTRSVSF
jgi:hypothetical protein